ncbi:MAG: Flp pilus assembly complex ATPase component TadA, partial [Oscillibacter sp.]|nr:Flp pilus assembly complex ATPase component TadA [Oscillibacter sp.]
MINLTQLIRSALDQGASDIHLTVGKPPIFRLHGTLVEQGEKLLTENDTFNAAAQLATASQFEDFRKVGEADFATTFQDLVRMRCNVFFQRGNTALALRLLPLRIPTVEELRLPEVVIAQADKPRGLVLVTGPTGSGKSSTLAALIDHSNQKSHRHIITLVEPIEYLH